MLKLRNTLTRRVGEFKPLENKTVRIYSCGPTVYGYGHIGNFRTFVAVDILRRYLKYLGYLVVHVMNITDVEDKIIRDMQEAGKSLEEFTEFYTLAFLEDLEVLRIETPEFMPRATHHIPEMVDLMRRLTDSGHTYQSEGSLYFSIGSFNGYGKLSGLKIEGNIAGARVDVDEYDKADARDFVLWKAPRDPGEPRWETPFGPGRPGWHLECSAMAMKYLGESFDIHCGGVDLIFPHHENEIAQSEAATGKQFVRYWFHVEFLQVEGRKMSKSLGNVYTLRDLIALGHSPEAVRYLLLSAPHGTQLNFRFEALRGAESTLERLRNFRRRVEEQPAEGESSPRVAQAVERARGNFEDAMNNDLNTSEALAALFDLTREINSVTDRGELAGEGRGAVLELVRAMDSVFGILSESEDELPDPEVEARIEARNQARRDRKFELADRIRDELADCGIVLEDTPQGTRWRRRR